jgi:hypothetical protein
MRLLFLTTWVCIGLCVLSGVRDVARADAVPRVVSESNGQIVIDIVEDGVPDPAPVANFFVAISNTGAFSVSLDATRAVKVTDPPLSFDGESVDSLRARSATSDTIRVYTPFLYRGTRVINIQVNVFLFPTGTDEVYRLVTPRVTIDYDPAPATHSRQAADPMLRELVVNEDVFPSEVRTTSPDPWFSLSNNWIRIPVTSRGVYAVTGQDLQQMVSQAEFNAINPSTLRLFSVFGQDQPFDLSDLSGSWNDGEAMREAAILVEDGGDGTFDPQDRLVFYAVGPEGWADYYDPSAPDTVYYQSTRARTAYYFLTWNSTLPGSPRRITDADGTPGAGPFVGSYLHREYREEDHINDFDFRGDGWLWVDIPESGIKIRATGSVDVAFLDASRPQTYRTLALARYKSTLGGANINDHLAVYHVRRGQSTDVTILQKTWTTPSGARYENGTPVRKDGYFLDNGTNDFILDVQPSPNPKDAMYFAWYSVFYHRFLQATANALGFSTSDTTGTVAFEATGFNSETTAYVFDVTDMTTPVRLVGAAAGPAVRFSAVLDGTHRHFWVAKPAGLVRPSGMTRIAPTDLRAETAGTNMLIVTDDAFLSSALRLRAYRASHLPYYDNARVKVVTVRDIYNNFSGGMPDAMAIRNYIKFLFDRYPDANNNPMLAYVLFFGRANEDFRNNRSSQPDYVPSNLYFTIRTDYTFVTDEWYGLLNSGDQNPGYAVPDVAIGRLPVTTSDEARLAVDKIIGYETDPTFGSWRNEIVLVADDEVSTNENACDVEFTVESEFIANHRAANFLETKKVYLVDYPRLSGGVKPASRLALLDAWNEGALVVNYIGHGSSQQMADELVFLNTDVGLLNNERRLPVLLALSCTIGDFANFQARCLGEKLVLRENGGTIAAVTASRESYPIYNRRLDFSTFVDVTPRQPGGRVRPLGETMLRAKMRASIESLHSVNQEENNWKYNLQADPAVRPRVVTQDVRFDLPPQDTLVAGVRKVIHGGVYRDGALDTGFNGSVWVRVREPIVMHKRLAECKSVQVLEYNVPGGVLYESTADVTAGEFSVTFRVPRSSRTGPFAFITGYADNGAIDAAGTLDSTFTLVEPTLADSLALRQIDGAPRVTLGFKSGLETVKPGETLRAVVRDADGINTLVTTNEGKQALLFDDLAVPIDANEFFHYDHGGADTSGVLLYPLPELSFGHHRAIYKVSDAFGNTTLDTLQFNVTDPLNYFGEVVLNYPNPFKTSTEFLVRLSDRADIRLDIFTVSGRRIRRIEAVRDGGDAWIPWDGRDAHGGEIANGTYLYVATIDFWGLDRPPLVVRGKVAKIQ